MLNSLSIGMNPASLSAWNSVLGQRTDQSQSQSGKQEIIVSEYENKIAAKVEKEGLKSISTEPSFAAVKAQETGPAEGGSSRRSDTTSEGWKQESVSNPEQKSVQARPTSIQAESVRDFAAARVDSKEISELSDIETSRRFAELQQQKIAILSLVEGITQKPDASASKSLLSPRERDDAYRQAMSLPQASKTATESAREI